ncbi:MAG: VOC family protein [Deltaproteobacteria bacterium]|nr:VOC family protein [Nannocystaceae bacterium]
MNGSQDQSEQSPITNVLAVVCVTDVERARGWYERALGRPVDREPMEGCLEWQLGDGGGLQVIADPEHAGHGMVTLGVDDIDAHVAVLRGRGLEVDGTHEGDMPEGATIRIAQLRDPDGNLVTFGEEPQTRPDSHQRTKAD